MEVEPSAPDTIMMPHETAVPVAAAAAPDSSAAAQQASQQAAAAAPAAQAAISANAFAAAMAQAMAQSGSNHAPALHSDCCMLTDGLLTKHTSFVW